MAQSLYECRCLENWTAARNSYIIISYALFLVLSALLLNDFFNIYVVQNVEDTTQELSMAVMLLHTLAFYFAILGFVYTTQTAGNTVHAARIGLGAIAGNLFIFIFRMALIIYFIGFREEYYRE